MNSNNDIFYSIYEIDNGRNKRIICGAKEKSIAEEMLRKHKGYENATIEWDGSLIYALPWTPLICEGIVHRPV